MNSMLWMPILFWWSPLEGAKIMLLYYPSYSHLVGPLRVASELAARGHVVWNALPAKLANRGGFQSPGVKILKYYSTENYDMETQIYQRTINGYFDESLSPTPFEEFKRLSDMILRDEDFIAELKSLKLDLFVFDTTPLPKMLTIIAYKLDVPFMFMGPNFAADASRTPFIASADPTAVLNSTAVMDFKHRLINYLIYMALIVIDPFSYNRAVSTYAPEKEYISLEALIARGILWLTEQEALLDYPRALLPNVKFIGSTGLTRDPLPPSFQKFMDDGIDGVVVVSFGSRVKSFPGEIVARLLEAFSKTKYRFVFSTNAKFQTGPNIMASDWVPQARLLAHHNTKLFITHCGANGQNEAFLNSVPMIGFPMYAEQVYNSMRAVYHGFGIQMDLKSFTVADLVTNINELIDNSTYAANIKRAAELARSLRQRSAVEEGAYWIEHVIKYGGSHLRSYCQDMPLYKYWNLDVVGLLLLALQVMLFVIWRLCICCCRIMCRRFHQIKHKQE